MPQASEELREKWQHIHGENPGCLCEMKAWNYLKSLGCTMNAGMITVPEHVDLTAFGTEISKPLSALYFLAEEWDYSWQKAEDPACDISLLVVDIETLGMEPPAALIELGWNSLQLLREKDSPILRKLFAGLQGSELFGIPEGQVMPPDNRAVHHINPTRLEGLPLFDMSEWCGAPLNDVEYVVAHNAEYEQKWLDFGLPWICTYKVALRLVPDAPSHSNGALKYLFDIEDRPVHHPPHRALPDAIVTSEVLACLIEIAMERTPELTVRQVLQRFVEISREPRLLPKCPIGTKWKGKPWAEVESGFLDWMLRQDEMEADLKWNARRELDRRQARSAIRRALRWDPNEETR